MSKNQTSLSLQKMLSALSCCHHSTTNSTTSARQQHVTISGESLNERSAFTIVVLWFGIAEVGVSNEKKRLDMFGQMG